VLSVIVAFNFAVAQPLLDVLGRHPEFFTVRAATRLDVIAVAVALTVVVPLLIAGVVRLVAIVNGLAGSAAHLLVVIGLLALFALQLLPPVRAPMTATSAAILGTGTLLSVGAAWAFYRSDRVRSFVRVGVIAPLAFTGIFLAISPVQSLVLPGGQSAAAEVRVGDAAHIVILVIDEFPVSSLMEGHGELDRELFPNFARLADDATWFRNTSANNAFTHRAIPSMLTGRHARGDAEPIAEDHPDNLFSLLGDSHRVWAREYLTQLCPPDVCDRADRRDPPGQRWRALAADTRIVGAHTLLPEAVSSDLPPIDHAWGGFAAAGDEEEADDARRFDDFVDALAPTEQPGLHYYHEMRLHHPWQHLESGERYTHHRVTPGLVETEDLGRAWRDEAWPPAHSWQRHLLSLGSIDRNVGAMLDRLEETGMYDDTLLIVTSDHGVGFEPGGFLRTAVDDNIHEIAFVPLFVKQPGQSTGEVRDDPVELLDLLPTILDVLEADRGPALEGRSLFLDPREARPRVLRSWGGEQVRVPSDLDEVVESAARRVDLFGTGTWEGVYRFGPRPELIGEHAVAVRADPEVGLEIELRDEEAFTMVDADATLGLVDGVVTKDTPFREPLDVAIAVNGVVAATATTFAHDDERAHVSVMVPPAAFRPGRNAIHVVPLAP
jgi:hypothetical protein